MDVRSKGALSSVNNSALEASECKADEEGVSDAGMDDGSLDKMSQEEKDKWEGEVKQGQKDMRKTMETMASAKSASANGKHIATMAEMQAVAKSERADTIATTNGSLTPPNLEGAAPLRMTSFREMMGKSKGE
jgi:Tfp pilus tip-associated adhesin PilY1